MIRLLGILDDLSILRVCQTLAVLGYAWLQGVRVIIEGGQSHAVDSSEMAFRLAAVGAFRQAFSAAAPVVLEPHMLVEVRAPVEYQGTLMGDLNRRRGLILDATGELEDTVISAQVRFCVAVLL